MLNAKSYVWKIKFSRRKKRDREVKITFKISQNEQHQMGLPNAIFASKTTTMQQKVHSNKGKNFFGTKIFFYL